MAAFLEINEGGTPRRIVCGGLVTLGRDVTSSLQVNDPLVSRIHALIRFVGSDSYYLLDAGSRNGSFVNNRRVSTPTLLRQGDVITLGDTAVTFIQEATADATQAVPAAVAMGETISHVRLEIQPITILVADIRGYTTLSEQIPIAVLSKMMTRWFSEVQEAIERRRGRVDKFIGDCVMALWHHGAEVEQPTILDCLAAACEIQDLTRRMRQRFPELKSEMAIAAGINTGMAAIGVGLDNTAMGDAVNLAFRLENACRSLDAELVLSQTTYQHLPEPIWREREMDIRVKGKSLATRVCSLNFADLQGVLAARQATLPS
jgi:adenylate cyclase